MLPLLLLDSTTPWETICSADAIEEQQCPVVACLWLPTHLQILLKKPSRCAFFIISPSGVRMARMNWYSQMDASAQSGTRRQQQGLPTARQLTQSTAFNCDMMERCRAWRSSKAYEPHVAACVLCMLWT
jgi:hypothetical protein